MIQELKNEIIEVVEKIRVLNQTGIARALTIEEESDLEELEMDLEDLCCDLAKTLRGE